MTNSALTGQDRTAAAEPDAHVPDQRDQQSEQYARDAELGRALREWHERSQAAQSSQGIAASADWRRVAMSPNHEQLQARRAQLGPNYQPIESLDHDAMARWVDTGRSEPEPPELSL